MDRTDESVTYNELLEGLTELLPIPFDPQKDVTIAMMVQRGFERNKAGRMLQEMEDRGELESRYVTIDGRRHRAYRRVRVLSGL